MVALTLPADGQGGVVDGNGAGHRAGDLVSNGEVVVVRRAVGGPGQIHVQVHPASGLPGVNVLGSLEGLRRRRRQDPELLEGSLKTELDARRLARHHQAVPLRDREVVVDRADARPVGTHDPGRPPGNLTVRVEADTQPSAKRAVLMDEIGVVRLTPQILWAYRVAFLVFGGDDVSHRHDGEPVDPAIPDSALREGRAGPGCMADAPGGPGTSTMGSSRSSNSVRRARDMTACWK